LIVLLFSISFLSGCATTKKRVVVQKQAVPSWYTHPPMSNEQVLYGIGDGKNRQEAISNALTMILSTLSVSISSSYSAKSVVREGRVNSSDTTYVNDTQSELKKIRISNYEVLESKELGFKRYGVLVKVDKYKFFLSLKKEIEQKFAMVQSKEKIFKQKDALRQVTFYKKTLHNLETLPNTLVVMSVLNVNFTSSKYLHKYDLLQKHYLALLQKISFWVSSNYEPLTAPIAKGLSAEKFTIKRAKTKMHFNVLIDANIQKATSYGFYIARALLKITTRDSKNSIVATNSIAITGQSSQSFHIAKQDLVKKLNKTVEKEGIAKVLQLEI